MDSRGITTTVALKIGLEFEPRNYRINRHAHVFGPITLLPAERFHRSAQVDKLFNGILIVVGFFCLLIFVLMIAFAIKFRHRPGKTIGAPAGHSTALELTWTIIPTIIAIVIFYYGFKGYLDETVVPPNAYEIQVHSQMWSWSFEYPNGYVDPELHIPKGQPIRLILSSADVIHSLYIPAFRVQKMTVPGRYNRFWLQATRDGEYPIFCASIAAPVIRT